MSHEKTAFAEFFRASWEPCLRAVVASDLPHVLANPLYGPVGNGADRAKKV